MPRFWVTANPLTDAYRRIRAHESRVAALQTLREHPEQLSLELEAPTKGDAISMFIAEDASARSLYLRTIAEEAL